MPAGQATHSRQTAKQAKAAFKARGSVPISSAERRKLERGHELYERAKRLKEQEQRKNEWSKRKDEQEKKKADERAVNLGSQHKLDKFGYKSSQLHLGNFFQRPKEAQATSLADEPWDQENVDEESLIDDVIVRRPDLAKINEQEASSTTETNALKISPTTVHEWSDFLDSSTQIERDLSGEKPAPLPRQYSSKRLRSLVSIPSWNSDEAFDEEDLADIESQIQSIEAQSKAANDKLLMPPPLRVTPPKGPTSMPPPQGPAHVPAKTTMRPPAQPLAPQTPQVSMGPPRLPPSSASKIVQVSMGRPRFPPPSHRQTPPEPSAQTPPSLAQFGISQFDLESLAADDIVLSQWS